MNAHQNEEFYYKDEIIIISDGPETPNSSGSNTNPLADLNANQLAALYLYTFGPWVAPGAIPGRYVSI